jgi:hypothetical protein
MPVRTTVVVALFISAVIATGRAEPQARPPLSLDPIFKAYASGDVDVVTRTVRSRDSLDAIRTELFEAIERWRPQRDLDPIAATFVFEVSVVGLGYGWPDAITVLDRGRAMVQQRLTPLGTNAAEDAFEIVFHKAALGALIGLQRVEAAERYLREIEDRVSAEPGFTRSLVDPRFSLIHGIAQELRTRPGLPSPYKGTATWGRLAPADIAEANEAIRRFDIAAQYQPTAAEASVRKANQLHRLRRFDDALTTLARVDGQSADPFVIYWSWLFRGRTLAALFTRQGRHEEALNMASAARLAPADTVDPWWRYWFGDLRFLPVYVDQMRKAGR